METLENFAQQSVGNWLEFNSFFWSRQRELSDADQWAIFSADNRDSGLLDQSNAEQIAEEMSPYLDCDDPDIFAESHNHWACGYVNGYSIRVYDSNGNITPAFVAYYILLSALDDYPVLDEMDYSEREYDTTIENIRNSCYSILDDYELPDEWTSEVYSWLWENDQSAVENCDDQGGYPSEEQIKNALERLEYHCYLDDDDDDGPVEVFFYAIGQQKFPFDA